MSETIQHDTKAAIKFLRKWCAEGPWVLCAIVPDTREIDTVTFAAENWSKASEWIESFQGVRNLYFHVNPTIRPLSSKAAKKDMARMAWLHVDVDPRAGEDRDEERARALRLLQNHVPRPTVIIDSGGGYQGFWKLRPADRLEVNGIVTRAEELELYNIQLEKLFQADNCHNIDRIMRLPGTINIPDRRKLNKGRTRYLASLVEFNDSMYPIEQFTPSVRVQTPESGLGGGPTKVDISGNVADVSVDDLMKWATEHGITIPPATLALIATGKDPFDESRYPSRSEALFRVVCDLVRAEVPNEMIYGVITGSNEIANSVRDKPNWERYAKRQILKAHEHAIDPMLAELNGKHAVIADMGGKCRIISEVHDPAMGRPRISKQSFEDFRNRYRHIRVIVGKHENGSPIEKPAGAFWVDHPKRRQYETIVFAPGKEVEDSYNLWKGFACDSLPGNKHESFLHHIRDNICSGNVEHYRYVIGWMARAVQQPDSPGEVAQVWRGGRGIGKSFAAKQFGMLFGRHFLQVSDSKHLVGSFNAHLRDTVVLFGDEAFFAGDKKHESVLKTLITEEHLIIEGKGVDAEAAPNYTHLILASNEDWVVPAGLDERRFFVMECASSKKQDVDYFRNIANDLDTGGRENLLHFLMTYPLKDFEVRHVPHTAALQDQKIQSMKPEEQWMFEKLWEGRLLPHHSGWKNQIIKDQLYQDYITELRDQGRNYRLPKVVWAKFLSRAFPGDWPFATQEWMDVPVADADDNTQRLVHKRVPVYKLPDLRETREHWDKNFGGPFKWPVTDIIQEALPVPPPGDEDAPF